jgi:uncharacterized Ntn-hydrolase superfamily protein
MPLAHRTIRSIPALGLSLAAALAPVLLAARADAQAPPLSTFSIVACDTTAGFLGVGIQSRVVGAGMIVPAAEAGTGAIATQAAANVAYKRQALDLLRAGRSADEVRAELLRADDGRAQRQFAVVDRYCRFGTHTGDSTLTWAGHRAGRHYSVQGNILTGPEVLEAMARAFEAAEAAGVPFGERLLAALRAGQDAGGDRRGRQGAGLLIVRPGGGYGGGDDRYADLRVEDHVEPILELERVYDVWMSLFHPADHFLPRGRKPFAAPAGPHVCELRRMLTRVGHDRFAQEGGWCAFDDEAIAALRSFQRAHGLREAAAVTPEVAARLRQAAAAAGPPE